MVLKCPAVLLGAYGQNTHMNTSTLVADDDIKCDSVMELFWRHAIHSAQTSIQHDHARSVPLITDEKVPWPTDKILANENPIKILQRINKELAHKFSVFSISFQRRFPKHAPKGHSKGYVFFMIHAFKFFRTWQYFFITIFFSSVLSS